MRSFKCFARFSNTEYGQCECRFFFKFNFARIVLVALPPPSSDIVNPFHNNRPRRVMTRFIDMNNYPRE